MPFYLHGITRPIGLEGCAGSRSSRDWTSFHRSRLSGSAPASIPQESSCPYVPVVYVSARTSVIITRHAARRDVGPADSNPVREPSVSKRQKLPPGGCS